MAYRIVFAESVTEHLRWLTADERSRVLDAVERRLAHEPMLETRNRKPMRPNSLGPWELRIGALRVFYEVALRAPDEVRVLAVGKKERRRLRIGGREIWP